MVRFDFQNPYNNFNRNLVLGRFCTLFEVKQPEKYCLALTQAAGIGKLRNVVVAQNTVASDFFKSGVLRSRETFMPLNTTKYFKIPPNQIQEIKQVTEGRAILALDLIKYDQNRGLEPVM